MFSNNIRQNKQFGWFGSDKTSTQLTHGIDGNDDDDDNDHNSMPPHTNSFTYNDKIEIINENDRNFVSSKPVCEYANSLSLTAL